MLPESSGRVGIRYIGGTVLDLSDLSSSVVQWVLQCNTSLSILLGVHSLTASLPRSCLCREGVCVIALHSERRCQLRDQTRRQTLPPVVIETRKLECRRCDNLVSEPWKARSGFVESAEDVLWKRAREEPSRRFEQVRLQLAYQSCCDKDGRIATSCEVSLQGQQLRQL